MTTLFFTNALQHLQSLQNHPIQSSILLNNMASLLIQHGDYSSAFLYVQKSTLKCEPLFFQ